MEDPVEAWLDGEVIEATGADIKVRTTSGKMVSVFLLKIYISCCPLSCYSQNPSKY